MDRGKGGLRGKIEIFPGGSTALVSQARNMLFRRLGNLAHPVAERDLDKKEKGAFETR